MTEKFSYHQRELLKQLVLECDVQRFTEEESLAYIKSHLKQEISARFMYNVKSNIRRNISSQLKQIREHKTMYINELFFKRRDELEKYQKELWRIYHQNPNDGRLQADCVRELHKVTVTLCQIFSELPLISGMTFFTQQGGLTNNDEKDISRVIGPIPTTGRSPPTGSNGSNVDDGSRDDYKPVV
jgi:hypothetical protein